MNRLLDRAAPRRRWFGLSVVLAAFGCRAAEPTRPEPTHPKAAPVETPKPAEGAAESAARTEAAVAVGFGGRVLRAEIRDDFAGRAQGYMGRTRIADDEALLFLYGEAAERGFWMKNCLVPLDILYLADDGRVHSVHHAAPPAAGVPDEELPRYPSGVPVRLVLEVRGGAAAEAGVGPGSRVELPPAVAALLANAEP
jgi:uncharacterized membrane protein (UPF0127 family)